MGGAGHVAQDPQAGEGSKPGDDGDGAAVAEASAAVPAMTAPTTYPVSRQKR
jgi:hypothetical protein